MGPEDLPAPDERILLTHSIVAGGVARSRDLCAAVPGGGVVMADRSRRRARC